ncbi:spectrin alpha chain-like [Amphiura filiformis]|uniref:spectrin alpha chain-like n=1 Tax=Amphiura filiformis TaxID=82378 RepID=UPI003B21EE8F
MDLYDPQRFSSDFHDLIAWINGMKTLVCSDELATDETGAEVLLERHQVLKAEIEDHAGSFQTFEAFGNQLLQSDQYASPEIQEKLDELAQERKDLDKHWSDRHLKLMDSYDLQRFLSNFHDLMAWINGMKTLVCSDELAKDVNGAEVLLVRHQELKAQIETQAGSFQTFAGSFQACETLGKKLLHIHHYASPEIQEKLKELAQVQEDLDK